MAKWTREEKRRLIEKTLSHKLTAPTDMAARDAWVDGMRLFDFGTEVGGVGCVIVRRETKPGELTFHFSWVLSECFEGVEEYLEREYSDGRKQQD